MSRQLKIEQQILIRQLHKLGWSQRQIENETGIRRETVSKYIREPFVETEEPTEIEQKASVVQKTNSVPKNPLEEVSALSKSLSSSFHQTILEAVQKGLSAQSIYQDLVHIGFKGSYTSVQRYVRKLRSPEPNVFARIHTAPGEEAQVDFGQGAPTLKDGKYVRPWLFTMVLSYSRMIYTEVVWHQDVETFLKCHENAFSNFGGVPGVIRIDNLKSGVLAAHMFEPSLNPAYADFASYCGFTPLPCLPATPQHKGKVEAGVKYAQDNALKGKLFNSLDEQNAHLRRWGKEIANLRIHGTTKRKPMRGGRF